jgi:2-keto-4-pentenoate hydratase/2-oxohepta-3-ene-1,7-dioic acid hydratase in catechol pathway
MQFVTTTSGVGRVEGDEVAILDTPFPDLGAVLWAHESLEPLLSAPVRARGALAAVELRAPVPRPGKVWAIGVNYRSHAAETGREPPTTPIVFVKVTSAVQRPGGAIHLPPAAPACVDFEGEVAIVIGRRATSVRAADAWAHVAGVTACNDVTARDVQRGTGNFGLAKSFDTFCPLGGSITDLDEYATLDDIGLTTVVDGEERQRARTSDLVFGVPELVEYLSRHTTLEPGDIISTGTPSGVGMVDERYLREGSTVTVTVEGVLPLTNSVIA